MTVFKNPADSEIKSVLKRSKNIAVVGLSKNSERDSYRVAEYLIRQGYQVLPVNPSEDLILGQKVYKDLVSIPFRVDIVNVFRRSSHLPGVVEEALEIKPLCIWAQLGVIDEGAASAAVDQGVIMVMDLCIKVEHRRLLGETVS